MNGLMIVKTDEIKPDILAKIFSTTRNWKELVKHHIKIYPLPNSSITIDLNELKAKLVKLQSKYPNLNRSKSDVEACNIIWKYLGRIPSYYMANAEFLLWLSIELREYIVYRFNDKGIVTKNRYDYSSKQGKERHSIARLYWGAKSSEAIPEIIKQLFSDQDLSVAILERAWSHKIPLIKWFFEYMQKAISVHKIIEKNVINDARTTLEFTNSLQRRLIIKIFYTFASQYLLDLWTKDEFDNTLKQAVEYSLNLYYKCQKEYYNYCVQKQIPSVSESMLAKQIVKLNNFPIDFEKWVKNISNTL